MNQTTETELKTFALLSYNQEAYIADAIDAALKQTYQNLEIIISDDCSSDGTFEIIVEITKNYSGTHKLIVNKNERNIGLAANVNYVMSVASGVFVVLAAGDDISYPERVQISADLLHKYPDCGEVLVSSDIIDKAGKIVGRRRLCKQRERVQVIGDLFAWDYELFGAGRAIRKNVFNRFGDLDVNCPTEDSTLLLRSMICGGSLLSNEVLVKYRVHQNNMSMGSNCLKIHEEDIYIQNLKDLYVGRSNGYVDDSVILKFRNWILVDQFRRGFVKKKLVGDPFTISEIARALVSPCFNLKTKLMVAIDFMGSNFRRLVSSFDSNKTL